VSDNALRHTGPAVMLIDLRQPIFFRAGVRPMSDKPEAAPASDVLVAEDEPAIARLMEALLVSAGYRVRMAADGQQALDAIAAERPALVVLDLSLPRVDGWQVLERLRSAVDPPPVIVLTGHSRTGDRAARAGAVATILKPFDVDDLLRIVERHVERTVR
jgi:DNA-binding response OmpR family regulator